MIPCIAVAMALWPSLSSGLERLQTDPGDTLLNLYFLEHAYQHFTSERIFNPDHYWSPDFFWPIRDTIAWSDHLLGQSVIYGVFRSLLSPFQSYVAWLATTLWFNYLAIRHACLRISPKTNAIWISLAALVTCFSPAIIQQLGHPQLLSLFLIGPILWLCHRLINETPEDFAISDWLILGTWILANGFFNIYIFVYASYGSLICTGIHIARRIQTRSTYIQKGINLNRSVAFFTACIAANLAIYLPYLNTLATFGKRPLDEILNNLPKPTSWLFGSSQWLLQPPLTPDRIDPRWISGAEQELFPGWGLTILLAAAFLTALWKRQRRDIMLNLWLVVMAMMVFCSLSISELSLWPIVSKVLPGASSLRASSRVAMAIVLYAAPSIAIAARHWHFVKRHAWEAWAACLAMVGGLASVSSLNQQSFSLARWQQERQALSKAINASDCDLFWYEWQDQAPWRAHVLAMHAQLDTGIPTANGYSGHFPKPEWPFTQPEGHKALRWITTAKPARFHKLKKWRPSALWCIASGSQKSNGMVSIDIRKLDPTEARKKQTSWIRYPDSIIFEAGRIAIGEKSGTLYLKSPDDSRPEQWKLITRDGIGISSKRGDYKIVSARESFQNNRLLILITDRNNTERTEYVWSINARNGRLLSQTMHKFPRK